MQGYQIKIIISILIATILWIVEHEWKILQDVKGLKFTDSKLYMTVL